MANPRLHRLQANIQDDLKEIDKRAAQLSVNEGPESHDETPWKQELRPYVENMKIGQLGPNIQGYCPIRLLSRLPLKFLTEKLFADVSFKFYKDDQFWKRTWILFV